MRTYHTCMGIMYRNIRNIQFIYYNKYIQKFNADDLSCLAGPSSYPHGIKPPLDLYKNRNCRKFLSILALTPLASGIAKVLSPYLNCSANSQPIFLDVFC